MRLFKYYSLNKYTLEGLKENSLYFNLKSNFNDPFDLNINFIMDKKKLIDKLPKLSNLIGMLNKKEYETLCYWNEQFSFKNIGIFCCSKTSGNILMWSHYANNHKGICVEFIDDLVEVIQELYRDTFTNVYDNDIKYDDTRQSLNEMMDYDDVTPLYQKAKCWEYEQEHRIMIRSNSIQFPTSIKLNKDYIKKIYFGCNTSVKDFLTLKSHLKERLKFCNTVFMYIDTENFKLKEKTLTEHEFELLIKNLYKLSEKDFYCKVIKKNIEIFKHKKYEKDFRDRFYNLKISDFVTYYANDFCYLDIDESFFDNKKSKFTFSLFINNFL